MKVLCVHSFIDDDLVKKYGFSASGPDFYGRISVGTEYVVLGLTYDPKMSDYAGNPIVEVKDDAGCLTALPIILFEIVDPRPSLYWQIRYDGGGWLTLYPESFYQEYYHDDLSEGVPEVEADFARVCDLLEKEAAEL